MKCYLVIFVLFLLFNAHNSMKNKNIPIRQNGDTQINSNSNEIFGNKTETVKNMCSQNCLNCQDNKCLKCAKGEYSYGNSCYLTCPGETLTDNYSFSCKNEGENPVYIKAYTFGRCINKCGSVFNDCSCEGNCIKNGNCCSDFKYCSFVKESLNSKNKCPISNCKACTSDQQICLMCNSGFYFYKNYCHSKCPEQTTTIEENNLCVDKPKCNIENCETCDKSNASCLKCVHGFFLHENECNKSCPLGTRANRIDFTCVNKSTFAFFMIFPSKYSCKNNCGYQEKNADCSCHHHCLKDGTCCDDFEQECKEEIKSEKCKVCNECIDGKCVLCGSNSDMSNGDCNCRSGYYYNIEQDACLPNASRFKKNNNNNVFNDPYSKENLEKLLVNFFNKENFKKNSNVMGTYKAPNSNIFLNGNVTMNIFSGNENPSIINENVVNENSYNNDTNVEKNLNSKNVILGTSSNLDYSHNKDHDDNNIRQYSQDNSHNRDKLVHNSEMKNNKDQKFLTISNNQNTHNVQYNLKQKIREKNNDTNPSKMKNVASELKSQKLNKNYEDDDGADDDLKFRKSELRSDRKTKKNIQHRKNHIDINKHFHFDHSKHFPEDLEHEEGVPLPMPEKQNLPEEINEVKPEAVKPKVEKQKPKIDHTKAEKPKEDQKNEKKTLSSSPNLVKPKNDLNDKDTVKENNNDEENDETMNSKILNLETNKNQEKINQSTISKPTVNEVIPNEQSNDNLFNVTKTTKNSNKSKPSYESNTDKIIKTYPDINKKVQVNINIPGIFGDSSDNNNKNAIGNSKIEVRNHYFINDKSVSMNEPKNPNVFNFYGNECTDGKCLKNDFGQFKNTKFISDKNFKEYNNTINIEKRGVNIVFDREDNENFLIPETQKDTTIKEINSLNFRN